MIDHECLQILIQLARRFALIASALMVGHVRADIYQWEYIDPADPSQGKQQSAELCFEGAGVNAEPNAYLENLDLSLAYLIDADLMGANIRSSDLGSADLSRARLTNALLNQATLSFAVLIDTKLAGADLSATNFDGATLTGADLTSANVRGANLARTVANGFTAEQLYSTASYKSHDLRGTRFVNNNLASWNFAEQDASGGSFSGATATNADFRQSVLVGTSFSSATLTGAQFANCDIRRASFFNTTTRGFTLAQLYSTASYQNKDLSGIVINGDLSGINLVEVDLSGAGMAGAVLTGANFGQANLTGSNFSSTVLTNANFTEAEVRGANFERLNTSNGNGAELTLAQLYATASYQARALNGIGLAGNKLIGANFADQDLSGAAFGRVVAFGNNSYGADLTSADFSRANLTNAGFWAATLTDANFTDAEIRGAGFGGTTSKGFCAAQLYSTANYRSNDLTQINLERNDLSGWNFAGKNLSGASLLGATLNNADFTNAIIRGTNLSSAGITLTQLYSTASYGAGSLIGVGLANTNLSGANFSGMDLTGADFGQSGLASVNFTNAEIRGAGFAGVGPSPSQVYSTASYQAGDLSGVQFFRVSRMYNGWSFEGIDLTDVDFSFSEIGPWGGIYNEPGADFTDAIIRGAKFAEDGSFLQPIAHEQLYSTASYKVGDLREIRFQGGRTGDVVFDDSYPYYLYDWNFVSINFDGAIFDNVDFSNVDFSHAQLRNARLKESRSSYSWVSFTGADLRGAYTNQFSLNFFGATWTNAIRPNGHITGLNLTDGEFLEVFDYDGDPDRVADPVAPIPVFVKSSMTMDATGLLRLIFEVDAWNSLISFQPGIPVSLGDGKLELTFAAGMDIASQVGRTFHVFDWTGVTPTGRFVVSSRYTWDVSKLYSTGEITLLAIPEPDYVVMAICSLAMASAVRRPMRAACSRSGTSIKRESFR